MKKKEGLSVLSQFAAVNKEELKQIKGGDVRKNDNYFIKKLLGLL